ncbi:MAG: hypothetical protein AAGB23_04595 [Pseudomonadota bacterium]
MQHAQRPVLQALLLLAIGLRAVFGAPCCVESASAEEPNHAAHAHHQHHSSPDEQNAGHDPSANPCCSACGPALPPDTAPTLTRVALHETPVATPILALATRPPFPAYNATGPPGSI